MDIKDLKPKKPTYAGFKQGYYDPVYPDKYKTNKKQIIYRSSWEYKLMKWLDLTQEVIEWASEPVSIKYFYTLDERIHTYYPDFYFAYRKPDGRIIKYIVEVKPTQQLERPNPPKRKTPNTVKNYNYLMECFVKNSCKRIAAKKWCEENGYHFVYVTEKSNLNFI